MFSIFPQFFASINKIFILRARLGTRLQFYEVRFEIFLTFPNFLRSQVLTRLATREATRMYQFITNNKASLHLWWKKNLVKHKKVTKYYKNDWILENKKYYMMHNLKRLFTKFHLSSNQLDILYMVLRHFSQNFSQKMFGKNVAHFCGHHHFLTIVIVKDVLCKFSKYNIWFLSACWWHVLQ